MPALGFLTVLFYQLLYNKFDAIEIDATYNTNNLAWELYAIMGVNDGTGFPLSYLLISAGKNRNITGVLIQWMQALKERNLKDFPYTLTVKISQKSMQHKQYGLKLTYNCVFGTYNVLLNNVYHLTKQVLTISYNPKIAHEECSTIDPNWGIVNDSNSGLFCPLNL
jgi:hypothetical protein